MEERYGGAGAVDERLFHHQCAVATQPGRAADTGAAEPEESGDGRRQEQQQRGQSTADHYRKGGVQGDSELVDREAHG